MFLKFLYLSVVYLTTRIFDFPLFRDLSLFPFASDDPARWVLQRAVPMKSILEKSPFVLSPVLEFDQALYSFAIEISSLKILSWGVLNNDKAMKISISERSINFISMNINYLLFEDLLLLHTSGRDEIADKLFEIIFFISSVSGMASFLISLWITEKLLILRCLCIISFIKRGRADEGACMCFYYSMSRST